MGLTSAFATLPGRGLGALACDGAGTLYASVVNQILKFAPDGGGSLFATANKTGAEYIVVVPEPSTCALFALGFAAQLVPRRARSLWLARGEMRS